MSDQDGRKASTLQYPTNDDKETWIAYWKAQGQPWRTELEVDPERQKYLNERRSITSDIEHGIYPFKDFKLSRADIEWLLATHEDGRGPIDWSDESQRERKGLDLRGADLHQVDLQSLPLAGLRGGLNPNERKVVRVPQRRMAAAHMEGTNLYKTHLEGASLFHGRGFFPGLGNETSLHNPLVVQAAIEAVIGLFIEISFIATFTQRFFGK